MATPKDLPQDVGGFIRDLRQTAKISLRQLADRAGVSNPYLSQIERGLRKPSAEVLQQLASALRVSTPAMYLRAGLLDSEGQQGVLAAIAADPELTIAQKQSLSQIYETFRNENARNAPAAVSEPDEPAESPEPDAAAFLAEDDALLAAAAQAEADRTGAEAVLAAEIAPAPKAPARRKAPARAAHPAPPTTPSIEEIQ
jgi:transcriptional regulator with XRE-family HTH domain